MESLNSMSRSYALRKLLEHGGLTRREIIEITGWKVKQVHYTLAYLAEIAVIKKDGKNWVLS
jgi:predicted transcriptional regulator